MDVRHELVCLRQRRWQRRLCLVLLVVATSRAMKAVRPYGSWPTPISAAKVIEANVGLAGVTPCDNAVYWLEARPTEGGRNVIVRRTADGVTEEAIPKDKNARTRVHEYGGGAWVPLDRKRVLYSNFKDQRIYLNDEAITPEPETPSAHRYADFDICGDVVYCVRETHSDDGTDVRNSIATVSLSDGSVRTLIEGSDFYAAPRVSPNGKSLAYVKWNHPAMPWDATTLIVRDLETGAETIVAGGATDQEEEEESAIQPHWSPKTGELHFLSDRNTGWYNLYKVSSSNMQVTPVISVAADLGDASPGWMLGQRGYDFDSDGRAVCAFSDPKTGRSVLARATDDPTVVEDLNEHLEKDSSSQIAGVRCAPTGDVYFLQASSVSPAIVARRDGDSVSTLKAASDSTGGLTESGISIAERIAFTTTNDDECYAYVYLPKNDEYEGPVDEKPPLLIKAHGGPTACAKPGYSRAIQFWCSRGFAVCDVDYRGSTGYGRKYRRALRGAWGVKDVDDVCAAAECLAARGLVDPDRLAIDGGSAGGYTTLGALAWRGTFKAGCSMYGIGDLKVLASDTHKFESRYLDGLVGGTLPEDADLYEKRAPVKAVDQLDCPVLLLQGAEDKIVPPGQATLMHDALKQKGVPTALKMYDGEQHGFRKAENIIDALNSELFFFSKVFGFDLPEDEPITPFAIDNLLDDNTTLN